MSVIEPSELIINPDGTIFHLHLKPEQLAEHVILVGDPGRVKMIAGFFEQIESETENREFVSATGTYGSKRITVLSTGIGTDNIDIVINELDALANIDLHTRQIKNERKSLSIIRIGTSGGLQGDIPVNAFLASRKAIGFDGLLNFYERREEVSDIAFEESFKSFVQWNKLLPSPYVVETDLDLFNKIVDSDFISGVTISAPGFYGPQGRELRLKIADPLINDKIEAFRFGDQRITNYEMECSAIYGLSKLLGHKALTVCIVIANRVSKRANEDYKPVMVKLVQKVLDRI
ncbi:MAG: nucleoside phosphorylase [Prolixibacteraceae bacterium]|jgi:uridine phosphorylase|nr:nucleoside phosphorylase [Prolixibacteraceae bacterium]